MTKPNNETLTTMSRCMVCGSHCTAHADDKSHGLCRHCLAQVCPNAPESIRHRIAMGMARARQVREGLVNTAIIGMLEGMDAR